MIEIATARKPQEHPSSCNVYGCEEPAAVVIEIGGGHSKNSLSTTSIRLCLRHWLKIASEGPGEAP